MSACRCLAQDVYVAPTPGWRRSPGEPERDLILAEVTYPPGTGSPLHLHANGVLAFVVSGSIASKVGEEPERTYRAR